MFREVDRSSLKLEKQFIFRKHKPHSGHRFTTARNSFPRMCAQGDDARNVCETLWVSGLGLRASAGSPKSESPGMPVNIRSPGLTLGLWNWKFCSWKEEYTFHSPPPSPRAGGN